MSRQTFLDPFSSKSLLEPSTLLGGLDEPWRQHILSLELAPESIRLADIEAARLSALNAAVLHLNLDKPLTTVEELNPFEVSENVIEHEQKAALSANDSPSIVDELWMKLPGRDPATSQLLSWDKFHGHNDFQPRPQLITEADPARHNVLLSQIYRHVTGETIEFAHTRPLNQALQSLMVGRSSFLFTWDRQACCFRPTKQHFSIPGCTRQQTTELCDSLCECGSLYLRLKDLCLPRTKTTGVLNSLQVSIEQILRGVEIHVSVAGSNTSILRLWETAIQLKILLTTVEDLCRRSTLPQTDSARLKAAIHSIDEIWHASPDMQPLMSQISQQLVEPATRSTNSNLDFPSTLPDTASSDQWTLSELLSDMHESFLNTVRCVRIVDMYLPHRGTNLNPVEWLPPVQTWAEARQLDFHAHQTVLASAESATDIPSPLEPGCEPASTPLKRYGENLDDLFHIDQDILSRELLSELQASPSSERLQTLTLYFLRQQKVSKAPELSPLLSVRLSTAPYLQAKSQSSSMTLFKALLVDYNLESHLQALYSFELLGDGDFAQRLSRALFDTRQYGAERRRNTGLATGLRLEDREVWPPASSELRLLLMGLITQATNETSRDSATQCISFSIRELSAEAMEQCRNVHSISALDFLRLTYSSTSPILDLVITPKALEKYDRIFRLLLTLLRLHALTQGWVVRSSSSPSSRNSIPAEQKFKHEFYHVITALIDFALNVAVKLPWGSFMAQIVRLREYVRTGNHIECTRLVGSISNLAAMHEEALDEILRSLLLKSKLAKLYGMMSSIFDLALRSAAQASPRSQNSSAHVTVPYQQFHQELLGWLKQIKNLVANSSDPAIKRLECFLLMVDMSDHYRLEEA